MSSSKGFGNSSSSVDQLSRGVSDMSVSAQDDGWEEYGKKSKNKNKNNASKQTGPQQSRYGRGSGPTVPALSSDPRKSVGRGYTRPQSSNRIPDSNFVAVPPAIPPPLKNGWGWANRVASSRPSNENAQAVQQADNQATKVVELDDDDEEESDGFDDSDDDLSDGFESDESQKSHETRKKNKWFKELFESLDDLTVEQINEPERQWHCPACKNGPGAIDWYRGLQPLITHAKTKRSKRVKLHRELAAVLDEELQMRGTSAVPAGEVFGKWKGLGARADKEIVWPPMVMIMNTQLEKDDNDKWKGMGNQELLDYFSGYSAVKARHSYGPQGHRGMSVLIFEASAVGYTEAERLSKHFEDNYRDRNAWDRTRQLFYSGGKRQLYGYMAEKHDLDSFNQHSQGKTKLKYEMESYEEMVVKQLKKMSEDNQQLQYEKNKAAKDRMSKKALEQVYSEVTEKLRKTLVDSRVVKQRTLTHHQQNKEEMDNQEEFYQDQIQQLYEARDAKEDNFEKSQLNEREKVTQSEANVSSAEDRQRKSEEIAIFIQSQDKEMAEFVKKRDELEQAHNEMMAKMAKEHEEQILNLKRQQWNRQVTLEKQFNEALDKLMNEYSPAGRKQGN